MDNESESMSTAEIDSSIYELRANPAYLDNNHPQHKDVNKQIESLYKRKHSAGNGQGAAPLGGMTRPTGEPSSNGEPSGDLLTVQAEAELTKLAELGVDVSGVDLSNATPERFEGIKHLRLIEENSFEELGASLTSSALKAGFPVERASFLRKFLREAAQPNDELTKDILTLIAESIYRQRTE